MKWIKDVNDTQHTDLKFPIVADADRMVAETYDRIHPGEKRPYLVFAGLIMRLGHKVHSDSPAFELRRPDKCNLALAEISARDGSGQDAANVQNCRLTSTQSLASNQEVSRSPLL